MPSLPARACSTPGCHGPAINGSRCDPCQAARYKLQDIRRQSSHDRGYDADHRKLRILCFQRDAWTCVDCGWKPDVVEQCLNIGIEEPPLEIILDELRQRKNRNERHLHGEHDIPIEVRPDLRLDLENYKTRCSECHSAKTMRELKGTMA